MNSLTSNAPRVMRKPSTLLFEALLVTCRQETPLGVNIDIPNWALNLMLSKRYSNYARVERKKSKASYSTRSFE